MDANTEKLLDAAEKSLADDTFVKLVLSNYKGSERGLQRISVRRVETKKGSRVMVQTRFDTRDVVKNFTTSDALAEIRRALADGFRNAHLFTTGADLQLQIGKRNSRLTTGKPSTDQMPARTHDREKSTLIDPNTFYLKALGISTDAGEIKSSQRHKWRQINKFVEILDALIKASPLKNKSRLRIVDMGSGKGYLTFAAYDHFSGGPRTVEMTGIEARAELVDLCNGIAKAGGFDGLKFVRGQIADLNVEEIDILIALHACDTATDDALFKGIRAKAAIIVAAPCCHKELRGQITPPAMLTGILKHGIMLERTAETLTDGIRSLLLEGEGYSTKIFEFVPTEHTPKNNMLAATRRRTIEGSDRAREELRQIESAFNIRSQRLQHLLAGGSPGKDRSAA